MAQCGWLNKSDKNLPKSYISILKVVVCPSWHTWLNHYQQRPQPSRILPNFAHKFRINFIWGRMAIIDNWGPLCQHGLTLIPAWISHIGEYASTHQYPNCRRRSLGIDKMTKADGRRRLLPSTSCCESLQWRHNGRDSISNHQPYDCFLNLLLRRRSKKISKLRVTGLCAGNSPGTVEFSAQMASNAENVSIWWRHHVTFSSDLIMVIILLYISLGMW